jgi:hypothetical protein
MRSIRAALTTIRAGWDLRDAIGAVGLCLLIFGGEELMRGAGFAAGGAVMVAVAVLVR